MMSMLDQRLQQLQNIYRAREGRELEILLVSDHGTTTPAAANASPSVRF